MSVEIVGLGEVLGALDELGSTDNVQDALGKACALVERSAKQNAPKDTGALRRSIESKVEGTQGIIFTALEYAPYVEYGTGLFASGGGRADVPWSYQDGRGEWHTTYGQHPQPFMAPALNENRATIIRIIKEAIGEQ